MTIKRRELLEGASVALASFLVPTILGGCDDEAPGPSGCDPVDHPLPAGLPEYAYDGPLGPTTLFEHGVVSGDPDADRVILWTRVSPADPGSTVGVFYEVALDVDFARRVVATTTSTDASRDFTVKVDATGLQAATTYYYRFRALGITSQVGRTRTLPSGSVSHLRFGMTSCSSLAHGYFHAYQDLAAREDLDLVLHLGDYIYEYGDGEYGEVRAYDPPHECLTLDDYRRRFKQYRKDPMLQAAHRQHPFVCVWDDHEVANDTYADGAENHMAGEGDFAVRRAAAMQAYFEYQPVRDVVPGNVYRTLRCGDLVDLVMLDTRQVGRSAQRSGSTPDDPSRTMLGAAQEAWLESQLASSTARWVMLGQQVMVSQFSFVGDPERPFNMDAWDGYALARERLFAAIEAHAAGRTVVLTGDIHSSWAGDVSRNPWDPAIYDPASGAGAIAVEFVTPGVTSPGGSATPDGEDFLGDLVLSKSPHLKLGDFVHKGYVVLDIQRTRIQADWFHIASVEDANESTLEFGFAAAVDHGRPRLTVMDRPTSAKRSACVLAP